MRLDTKPNSNCQVLFKRDRPPLKTGLLPIRLLYIAKPDLRKCDHSKVYEYAFYQKACKFQGKCEQKVRKMGMCRNGLITRGTAELRAIVCSE